MVVITLLGATDYLITLGDIDYLIIPSILSASLKNNINNFLKINSNLNTYIIKINCRYHLICMYVSENK